MTTNDPTWVTITVPVDSAAHQSAPHLVIAPTHDDPVTGQRFVHRDYIETVVPWQIEAHIPPINRTERLGDVASWASYILRYLVKGEGLLTWSAAGLRAVLDYVTIDSSMAEPGRCQWIVEHPFTLARQWQRWLALANGTPRSQKQLIEYLEDLAEDIVDPPAHELTALLRKLRATVNTQAASDLNEDGSTKVTYSQAKAVTVELPPAITIAIPALAGHVDADGKPVVYKLAVRLRVSVGDDARLGFRLSIPGAEVALDNAVAEQVTAARVLLGGAYTLLRSV